MTKPPMIASSLGIARAATRSSALRVSASKLRLLSTLDESHRIHEDFLRDVAKVDPPKRLRSVLELSSIVGEELCSPRARAGLNPFLIPISKNKEDNSMTCFIRWPTQKRDMDLQIVKTTESGVRLYSLSADHYCHRIAVELDFLGSEKATKAIDLLNIDGELYTAGRYLSLLQSGKFPIGTESELRLVLDRYLLTKVGAFPDCYERLATNFANNGDATSALITCERSTSVFYSWGHAIHSQTKMMRSLGRHLESKESARASMAAPKWTLGGSKEVRDRTQGGCQRILRPLPALYRYLSTYIHTGIHTKRHTFIDTCKYKYIYRMWIRHLSKPDT
jgi:hypothetical protein